MSKLILGINGSPRKNGNTDFLLQVALDEASKVPGVKTETIFLRDYTINPCIGCFSCCNEPAAGGDKACMIFKDGMDDIYPRLKACDALIIASPVYFGSMTSQTKAFMDRTEGLLRYGTSTYQYTLKNKLGAGIAVGGNRNGGQEFTIQAIHYYFFIHDMLVVGSGPEITPGCYLGGCGTNSPQRGKFKDACKSDELGIKSCKMVGNRVAEMLRSF